MADWDRYRLLVHTTVNGPTRGDMLDDFAGQDTERPIREVTVTVWVDLYCERCDIEIAALEPDDVYLNDLVSVIDAHEPVCIAAPSWDADHG